MARCSDSPSGFSQPASSSAGPSADTVDITREYGCPAFSLKKTGGNQSQAARLLGISRATLIYRMKKHGLS